MPQVQNKAHKWHYGMLTTVFTTLLTLVISVCRADSTVENLIDKISVNLVKETSNMYSTPLNELFWVNKDADTSYKFNQDKFGSIVTP